MNSKRSSSKKAKKPIAVEFNFRTSSLEFAHSFADLANKDLGSWEAEHAPFENCRPSVPLTGLRAGLLSELIKCESGKCCSGRVIYGVLCVDPMQVEDELHTVLADDSGVEIDVIVHLAWLGSEEKMAQLFPLGARVAIKEPYMERCSGVFFLSVLNPANVEVLCCFPERLVQLQALDAEALRREGNMELSRQNVLAALELYTMSIKTATKGMQEKDRVLLAYTNRAECYLELQKFGNALDDAEKALSFDPHHVKSLYRKGRALHGLKMYKQAVESFQLALKQKPAHSKFIQEFLDKSSGFTQQGIQELLTSFYSKPCEQREREIPELCDYVGPLEIQAVDGNDCMGLFATEEVKAGEIVMVCNPVGYTDEQDSKLVFVKAIRAAINSPRILEQLYVLSDKISYSSCSGQKKTTLQPPRMSLFLPNVADEGSGKEQQQVDLCRIFNVVRDTCIKHSCRGSWILPGFISHSCVGNLLQTEVGAAKIFRANRDIAAGEQLTYCYVNSFLPLSYRAKALSSYGVSCSCRGCSLEIEYGKELEVIVNDFSTHQLNFIKNFTQNQDQIKLADVAIRLEEVLKRSSSLTDEDKRWLRAAYFQCYQLYYIHEEQERVKDKAGLVPSQEKFVMDVILKSSPGSMMALALALTSFRDHFMTDKNTSLVFDYVGLRYGHLDNVILGKLVADIMMGSGELRVRNKKKWRDLLK